MLRLIVSHMPNGPVLLFGRLLFAELIFQKKSTQRKGSTCPLFHLPVSNKGLRVSNGAKKTFHMNATLDFHAINFSSCSIWIFYCNWLNFSELISIAFNSIQCNRKSNLSFPDLEKMYPQLRYFKVVKTNNEYSLWNSLT